MRNWLSRVVTVVGLSAIIAAIWFVGPSIGFNGAYPLGGAASRLLLIVPVFAVLAGLWGLPLAREYRRRRVIHTVLDSASAVGSDAPAIQERLEAAVATLHRAGKKGKSPDQLPWYILIGPGGSGKTTALANSDLNFPLTPSRGAQRMSSSEPNRHCEWWFAENGVVIDTPGRYTTHGAAARSDGRSWLALLSLLKAYRGKKPISGVILACSVEDLIRLDGPALGAQSTAIRDRLHEIRAYLQVEFPVYVLFTKIDRVPGFAEFAAGLDREHRRGALGASLDPTLRVKEALLRSSAEFESLVNRLAEEATDRLQEEADTRTRISIFNFPAEFGLLGDRVTTFLRSIFANAERTDAPRLRGFYFAAGLQQDASLGPVLGNNLGQKSVEDAPHAGQKGFFLHDLLAKVIFTDAGWTPRFRHADWRGGVLRYGGSAAAALVGLGALAALGISFAANRSMIATIDESVDLLREDAQSMLGGGAVSDADVENVIELLQVLRYLPAGYETRGMPTPVLETFGLSQRERLHSASVTAYGRALERLFRSRLLLQLERTIEERMSDPFQLYEPLKIYLVLGGQSPKRDDELVVAWLRRDWERRYPGSSNREGRAELERHLRAMLELSEAHGSPFQYDRALVESAQRSLGRMTLLDWAEILIRSAASSAGLQDFSPSLRAGREAELVFETTGGDDLSGLTVSGFYTYAGFNDFYLVQLAGIAQKLVEDQWVIGNGGERGLERDLPRLGPELLARYGRNFANAWNAVLDRLKFKSFSVDKPRYVALSAAATPASPIKQLFEAIADETALSEPATHAAVLSPKEAAARVDGLARIGIQLPYAKSQSRAGAAFADQSTQHPGANIEAQFRPYHLLVSGPPGQRPIDVLIQNLRDIHQSLELGAAVPAQAERANANLQLQIANLRTNASRLPKTLSRMVNQAANEFESDAAETSVTKLNQLLSEAVTAPCEAVIAERYPFAATGADDVAMADFIKMFAPNGVLDRFFVQYVAPLTDFSGPTWQWKRDSRLGRELSGSTLKEFQMAAGIRDAFFPAGSSTPAVDITFTPSSLHGDVDMALLDVSGQLVQSSQTGSAPVTITWPGVFSSGDASLNLTPELPGRESALRFQGPWALKRLLDTATITQKENAAEARFVIGGRDIAYTIQTGSSANPLLLPALSAFRCPTQF